MEDTNINTNIVDKETLKKQRKAKRAEDRAIRRLRFLLIRV